MSVERMVFVPVTVSRMTQNVCLVLFHGLPFVSKKLRAIMSVFLLEGNGRTKFAYSPRLILSKSVHEEDSFLLLVMTLQLKSNVLLKEKESKIFLGVLRVILSHARRVNVKMVLLGGVMMISISTTIIRGVVLCHSWQPLTGRLSVLLGRLPPHLDACILILLRSRNVLQLKPRLSTKLLHVKIVRHMVLVVYQNCLKSGEP
mmetsp:Transcript_7266/g.9860  ORF Transcript_7266/g.9860 Transcript_7266/m.9860 type:complete len:202 (-) Transcript_7266:1738-2343(-)